MDLIIKLLGGVGLAAACGLSPYLPLLILSVAAKGKLITLTSEFSFLNRWAAILILAGLMSLELVADKIPQIQKFHLTLNQIIVPIAGGIAFAATVPGDQIPIVMGFLIGAVAAEIMFLVKNRLRSAIVSIGQTAKLFEPLISIGQDILAVFLAIIALLVPLVGGLLAIGIIALGFWGESNLKRRQSPAKVEA